MLSLIQNNLGKYLLSVQEDLKSSAVNTTPTTSEFEAYKGIDKKTELVGATTLGEQTQKVMREAPGQGQLEYDPETGTYKTKGETKLVEEKQPTKITTLETPTGAAAATTKETPIEKASRIAAMTRPQTTSGPSLEDLQKLFQPQQLSTKDKLINTALSVGADIGSAYLMKQMGIGAATSSTPIYTGGGFGGGYMGTTGGGGFSGAGGAGLLSGITTFAQTGDVGAAVKSGAATAAGTAIGTAVGGPIGGAIGGAIGSVIGCFLPDTLIRMADGSEKKIIDIDIKDNLEVGGLVFATGKFLINNLFDYKGIKVSGEHLVNESGKWLKVKQSQFAKSLGNDEHIVYTLGSQNRRILINNILFTDYFDFEEQKTLAA